MVDNNSTHWTDGCVCGHDRAQHKDEYRHCVADLHDGNPCPCEKWQGCPTCGSPLFWDYGDDGRRLGLYVCHECFGKNPVPDAERPIILR